MEEERCVEVVEAREEVEEKVIAAEVVLDSVVSIEYRGSSPLEVELGPQLEPRLKAGGLGLRDEFLASAPI